MGTSTLDTFIDEDKSQDYVAQVLSLVSAGTYSLARQKVKELPEHIQGAVRRTVALKTNIYL